MISTSMSRLVRTAVLGTLGAIVAGCASRPLSGPHDAGEWSRLLGGSVTEVSLPDGTCAVHLVAHQRSSAQVIVSSTVRRHGSDADVSMDATMFNSSLSEPGIERLDVVVPVDEQLQRIIFVEGRQVLWERRGSACVQAAGERAPRPAGMPVR